MPNASDLSRFSPHALALVDDKLTARESALIGQAVRALDSEDGLTPQQAFECIIAVREARRLRADLERDVKRLEHSTADRHPGRIG